MVISRTGTKIVKKNGIYFPQENITLFPPSTLVSMQTNDKNNIFIIVYYY